MSRKTVTAKSTTGVSVSGSPDTGQTVTLKTEKALKAIFGTKHPEMAQALLNHCFKALNANEASDEIPGNDERTFMVLAVAEIEPRDTFERMLAVQMTVTHVAMMRSARRLAHVETIEQSKAHYSGFNKLARTYAMQMETLRKHRNGGKQVVTVQHVNVSEGGQAIVGNVATGGEGQR